MKQALKEALAETLHEQREQLHEIFAEAIREGWQTERVGRGEAFDDLEDRA